MLLNEISEDVVHQALANIRLEGHDLSDELKDILKRSPLDENLTTTEILKKPIANQLCFNVFQ